MVLHLNQRETVSEWTELEKQQMTTQTCFGQNVTGKQTWVAVSRPLGIWIRFTSIKETLKSKFSSIRELDNVTIGDPWCREIALNCKESEPKEGEVFAVVSEFRLTEKRGIGELVRAISCAQSAATEIIQNELEKLQHTSSGAV